MRFIDRFCPSKGWRRRVEGRVRNFVSNDLRARFKQLNGRFLMNGVNQLNEVQFPSEKKFQKLMEKYDRDLIVFRNHPVCNRFFVDFLCPQLSFIIEIDGKSHNSTKDYDKLRDEFLEEFGYKVLRLNVITFSSWYYVTSNFIESCRGRPKLIFNREGEKLERFLLTRRSGKRKKLKLKMKMKDKRDIGDHTRFQKNGLYYLGRRLDKDCLLYPRYINSPIVKPDLDLIMENAIS